VGGWPQERIEDTLELAGGGTGGDKGGTPTAAHGLRGLGHTPAEATARRQRYPGAVAEGWRTGVALACRRRGRTAIVRGISSIAGEQDRSPRRVRQPWAARECALIWRRARTAAEAGARDERPRAASVSTCPNDTFCSASDR
jgi:hypothetical protein